MYQFNMSIGNEKAHWFKDTEKVFVKKIKTRGGITAAVDQGGRLNISVACESKNKQDIVKTLRECIAEIFLTTVKLDYLSSVLTMPLLKSDSYKLLLHTLVAFDRDTERDIIYGVLSFGDSLALDGLFNFRLGELKKRWNDIAELAVNNSAYLNSDETLNELLKFLMSAISPKITKLEVVKRGDCYNIKGDMGGEFKYRITSPEQLMIYLINIAPVELILRGSFENDKIFDRLTGIFDITQDDGRYGKNLKTTPKS